MSQVVLPLVEDGRKTLTTQDSADHGVPAIAEGGARGPSLKSVGRLVWSPWEWGP